METDSLSPTEAMSPTELLTTCQALFHVWWGEAGMSWGSHPPGQTNLQLRERERLGKRTGCQGRPPPERTTMVGRKIQEALSHGRSGNIYPTFTSLTCGLANLCLGVIWCLSTCPCAQSTSLTPNSWNPPKCSTTWLGKTSPGSPPISHLQPLADITSCLLHSFLKKTLRQALPTDQHLGLWETPAWYPWPKGCGNVPSGR